MLSFPELLQRTSGPPIGTFLSTPAIIPIEIVKLSGFDFVVIDTEHALISMRELDNMIVIARALDLPPLVRVADHGYADVQRILDAGAAGIFVPHVSSATSAATVVSQMIHPPVGTRGAHSGMRAAGWGLDPAARARYTDPSTGWRVAMIEERRAVDDIDEILLTEHLSAVFIGPGDLSISMGRVPSDPEVRTAIDTVRERAKAAGVPVATVASDADGVKRLVDEGYDWVVASNDIGLFSAACRDILSKVRPR